MRFLRDAALQKPGLPAGLLLQQRRGDSLTGAGCAVTPLLCCRLSRGAARTGCTAGDAGGQEAPCLLLPPPYDFSFIKSFPSVPLCMSYVFCSSSEAFMPVVASLHFSCALSDTCKPLWMGLQGTVGSNTQPVHQGGTTGKSSLLGCED